MTDKLFYVYEHVRNDTGTVFYVGKGKYDKELKYKRAYSRKGRNSFWNRIVEKAGYIVNIIESDLTEQYAFNLEIQLIAKHGRVIDKINPGGLLCNMTIGGEGSSGYIRIVSNETRKKISLAQIGKKRGPLPEEVKLKIKSTMTGQKYSKERVDKVAMAMIGKKASAETKRKMSESAKGKLVSNETRKKLSIALTGKSCSEETKAKLSAINTGKKLSPETIEKLKGRKLSADRKYALLKTGRESKIKPVINDNTGVIYESLRDAANDSGYTPQTLSRYLRGDRKNKTSMRYL